ncbi:hypothetical protein [Paenibacillus lactis]|uniref:Uncharacterized protein n=1 Tax=Paenibacillus lactis TaxID=228574 RepID=A0ABS4F9U2_9BACL|nr:hypothetical protein [Paenibacillus lactis]MBP1893002.1 hypothetical protein [Paenibacillus lactis]HAF97529.1 hypothetical protein [Paenibacillus lactis]
MEDIDYLGLFIIPVATAILTTVALMIKEWFQSRNTTKRALTEKKLVELYNQLYSIVIRYEGRLQFTYRKEVYDIDPNGKEKYHEIPEAEDPEVWEEAIQKASDEVYNKIHLLEYEDLILWIKVENGKQEEYALEDHSVNKALSYRDFSKSVKKSYGRLYNEFHLSTRQRKKTRINELKKKLKNLKRNPFPTKEEKTKQKKALKEEIKKIKRA